MIYLLIEHKVEDFNKWKPVYDEHESVRRKNGLKEVYLLKSSDGSEVVALFEGSDPAKVREFIASEDLKKVMRKAGVIGTPTIHILERAAVRKAA